MTIEEMINNGCTLEDAMDALDELWEKAVAEKSRKNAVATQRNEVTAAYTNYLKFLYPSISATELEKQVAELEKTLILVERIFTHCSKIDELQQKSKEQTNSKPAADKKQTIEEFLKKMGW